MFIPTTSIISHFGIFFVKNLVLFKEEFVICVLNL
jgi:hypothetical protein